MLPDYQDDIVQQLQRSIQEKDLKCKDIRTQLYSILDNQAATIKDTIIDATINNFIIHRNQLVGKGRHLLDKLSDLREDADSLRSEIESIDHIKTSLTQALEVASSIGDLRQCEIELRDALQVGDFDTATRLVVKFHTIIDKHCGDQICEPATIEGIKVLEKQLINAVGRKFREGIIQRDKKIVSQFAKLFYPLNLHEEGTYCYINFLRETLSNDCAANFRVLANVDKVTDFEQKSFIYAEVLTKVFIAVIHLIQEHQQNVEKVFGSETYLTFLRGLEEETDVQIIRVLDKFESDNGAILTLSIDTMTPASLKKADLVLEELALLSFRCQEFSRFIHKEGQSVVLTDPQHSTPTTNDTSQTIVYSSVHGLAVLSAMVRRIQELMSFYVSLEHAYASRSLHRALSEAEVTFTSNGFDISTLPNDVFFVLRKSVTRSISSCDDFAVCAVINLLTALLSSDVRTYLEQGLQSSSRLYSEWASSRFGPGSSINSTTEFAAAVQALSVIASNDDTNEPIVNDFHSILGRPVRLSATNDTHLSSPCKAIFSWPTLLNDLATCGDYVDLLVTNSETSFAERWEIETKEKLCVSKVDTTNVNSRQFMFQQSILGLSATKKEFHSSLEFFSSMLIDVMLQPIFVPSFREFESVLTDIDEGVFADYQVNDPFVTRFLIKLNDIIQHIRQMFCPTAYTSIMTALISHLTMKLEDMICKKSFSLLGAVQLEGDVRRLLTELLSLTDTPVRSKFSRIMEIIEILNITSLDELQQLTEPLSMGKTSKLSLKEIQHIISRRVDLPSDQVKQFFLEMALIGEF